MFPHNGYMSMKLQMNHWYWWIWTIIFLYSLMKTIDLSPASFSRKGSWLFCYHDRGCLCYLSWFTWAHPWPMTHLICLAIANQVVVDEPGSDGVDQVDDHMSVGQSMILEGAETRLLARILQLKQPTIPRLISWTWGYYLLSPDFYITQITLKVVRTLSN